MTIQLRKTTDRVLPNIFPGQAGNSSKTQLGRAGGDGLDKLYCLGCTYLIVHHDN
jgi:hypothetical protein